MSLSLIEHKVKVEFKESADGRKYPYADFGSETHGRKSFRLWVSGRLLTKEDEIYCLVFPVIGGRIEKTEKGNYVLRPNEQYTVHWIYVPEGYRGSGTFEILLPKTNDYDIFRFRIFRSPRGSTGIGCGALVNVPRNESLKFRWQRTGRLYGAPSSGISILHPDGREEEYEMLADGLESLDELPTLEEE